MAKKKDIYLEISAEELEGSSNSVKVNLVEDELEERFDKDFWVKVKCLIFVCCSCVA